VNKWDWMILFGVGCTIGIVFSLMPRPDTEIKYPYYTCTKDQVSEIIYNQPNGMLEAIKARCTTHAGGDITV
jgi:hypothetical protein